MQKIIIKLAILDSISTINVCNLIWICIQISPDDMCQGGKEEYDKHETKTRKNEINVGDVSSVMYLLIKDLVY